MDDRVVDRGEGALETAAEVISAGFGDESDTPRSAGDALAPMGVREGERLVAEVTARLRAKAAALSVAEAELVDVLGELRALEAHLGMTARQWVSWQCGFSPAETRQVFALSERLPELPKLDAALRSGVLSPGVTATLVAYATPENEAQILAATECATGAQLQVVARDFRRARQAEAARLQPDEDPAVKGSTFWAGWVDDGRYRGNFDLRPDEGAVFEAAYEAARNAGRLDEAAIDAGATANPVVEGEATPTEKRRATGADALLDLARTYLHERADADGDLPEETQIHLLREVDPNGDGQTILPGSGALDPAVAETLACCADRITQDTIAGFPASQPLKSRTFTTAQRRSLRARDRCCRFPGCARTRHLHAHHTVGYGVTRHTTIAEGALFCHYHHWLVHHCRYRVFLDLHNAITIVRPDGTTLRGAPRAPPAEVPIRGPDPPADVRRTGTNERLTHYARDVLVASWLPPDQAHARLLAERGHTPEPDAD